MRILLVSLVAALASVPVNAQQMSPEVKAAVDALNAETHCYAFPGPDPSISRPVCVWWPKNAPNAELPVIYMADGMLGIYVAAIDIKPALELGKVSPFMIVSVNAKEKPEERADEYVNTRSGAAFEAHEAWLVQKVIPWAEQTKRASKERSKRFIGGFSNGADLAWSLANRHPDLFGGALIHSPTGASAAWVGEQVATQRWVITGGTDELRGSIRRGAQLPRDIIYALDKRGAAVRGCIGRWEHEVRAWRQLTPGSITWLMGLGTPQAVENAIERGNCKTDY